MVYCSRRNRLYPSQIMRKYSPLPGIICWRLLRNHRLTKSLITIVIYDCRAFVSISLNMCNIDLVLLAFAAFRDRERVWIFCRRLRGSNYSNKKIKWILSERHKDKPQWQFVSSFFSWYTAVTLTDKSPMVIFEIYV